MAVRDWITSPREWGEWGMRANVWFNEIRDAVVSQGTAIESVTDRVDVLEPNGIVAPVDTSFTTTAVPGLLLGTYTIPEDGVYMYQASCLLEYAVAATYFVTFIARNESDATLTFNRASIDAPGTRYQPMAFNDRRTFTAGQEIRLYIYRSNSSGSVLLRQCHMTVRRVE